ncbi:MAG: prepilin-type N-terminal cleavage/methylation domain-containing protein [Deltaproteobacteria bacterium]|nr:prepilin-type N-terminal cleavage/methylation domain-containing protein [Deltaproteobacteria bacterium]
MSGNSNTKGYTFIEITIVIILIGVMASISMPKIRHAILTDKLKSTSRKMIGLISSLRNDAIRQQKAFYLHFDLEANRFWTDSEAMLEEERLSANEKAASLPEGISVLDVWFRGKGKKQNGTVVIRFNKKGYVQESAIHLSSDDGRQFTLFLSPFLGKIKAFEDYMEFEDS